MLSGVHAKKDKRLKAQGKAALLPVATLTIILNVLLQTRSTRDIASEVNILSACFIKKVNKQQWGIHPNPVGATKIKAGL